MSLARFQFPYMTTAQRTAVTPNDKDFVFDTDLRSLFIGDGTTVGGVLLVSSGISLLDVYPIGSIYTSVVSTNPSTLFGGTWSAFGAGRVLVGLNSADTDFDTAEETGGAKTVASAGGNTAEAAHTHSVTSNVAVAAHSKVDADINGDGTTQTVVDASTGGEVHSVTNNAVTSGAGSSHNHAFTGSATSVVQPYIVVYFFKRTA